MSQTKKGSLIESVIQTVIGAAIGLLTQLAVFPLFDMNVNFADQLWILLIFTVVGTIRSYIVRRMFNRRLV